MNNLLELLTSININPHELDIYELALTHPSYNADVNTKHQDYERLEYMGDAVLGFVVAGLIFNFHSDMSQGNMSKLRSYLVKTESLAKYARQINLPKYIRTGHSIDPKSIEKSNKILEDVFEALIGAIYLDQGIEIATDYITKMFTKDVQETSLDVLTDAKTRLQEEMQAEHRDSVHYEVIKMEGPAHDRVFTVNVLFNDIVLGTGLGKSKKIAEENAASDALRKKRI